MWDIYHGAKMKRNTHHVVRNLYGGWSVRRGGSVKATKTFDSKQDATRYAEELSKTQHTELVIHRDDGTIEYSAMVRDSENLYQKK